MAKIIKNQVGESEPILDLLQLESGVPAVRLSHQGVAGNAIEVVSGTGSVLWSVDKAGNPSSGGGGSQTLAQTLALGNSANSLQITSLAAPSLGTDASNKTYVDGRTLAQILAVGNSAGTKIVSLTDPSNPQDAATKAYVDANVGGGAGATWQGAYSGATTYAAGDIVSFADSVWISKLASNLNHTPPNVTWWDPMFVADSDYRVCVEKTANLAALAATSAGAPRVLLDGGSEGAPLNGGPGGGHAPFFLDPADSPSAQGERTLKARIIVNFLPNETSMGTTTLTAGLYPVSAFGAGGAGNPILPATLGTVVTGSTVAFVNPAASTPLHSSSGDFTFPAAGWYVLGVAISVGMAASSDVMMTGRVERRWV